MSFLFQQISYMFEYYKDFLSDRKPLAFFRPLF